MNPSVAPQAHDRLVASLAGLGLPRQAIAALLERHTLVRYPRGATLFSKGSPADVVFAVLSGMIKVHSSRTGSDRVLVEIAGPGDLVGYADFAEAGERSQLFEAEALSNCCVALITRQHVLEVLKALEPDAILRLAEALNSLWSSVAYRYATLLGMSLRKRLELVLGELAARFGVEDSRGILLTPELAQEDLAEMIGSSRPMVSKLLMEMAQQGVIARDGRHIVLRNQRSVQPEPKEPGEEPAQAGKPSRPAERGTRSTRGATTAAA
jgi:CRP-like cAMP-binding protein